MATVNFQDRFYLPAVYMKDIPNMKYEDYIDAYNVTWRTEDTPVECHPSKEALEWSSPNQPDYRPSQHVQNAEDAVYLYRPAYYNIPNQQTPCPTSFATQYVTIPPYEFQIGENEVREQFYGYNESIPGCVYDRDSVEQAWSSEQECLEMEYDLRHEQAWSSEQECLGMENDLRHEHEYTNVYNHNNQTDQQDYGECGLYVSNDRNEYVLVNDLEQVHGDEYDQEHDLYISNDNNEYVNPYMSNDRNECALVNDHEHVQEHDLYISNDNNEYVNPYEVYSKNIQVEVAQTHMVASNNTNNVSIQSNEAIEHTDIGQNEELYILGDNNEYVRVSDMHRTWLDQQEEEFNLMKKARIYLIGHSFISHIADAAEHKTTPSQHETVRKWNNKLNELEIDLEILGQGGAKFSYLEHYSEVIKEEKPDGVVIDLGSNDLCLSKINPSKLAEDISRITEDWVRKGWIKAAVICHIAWRTTLKKSYRCDKTLDDYNRDVEKYNKHLACRLKDNPKIVHWRHKGLRHPKISAINKKDGVHPDTETGFPKYVRSLSFATRVCKNRILKSINGNY